MRYNRFITSSDPNTYLFLPLLLIAHHRALHSFTPLETYLAALEPSTDAQTQSQTQSDLPDKKKKAPAQTKEELKNAKKAAGKASSRGVEQLKKVDTKGMNKLSAFFKKK